MAVGKRPEMSILPIVPQLTICQQWPLIGLREFIVRIPTHYLPTMGQQNYFLLAQHYFKVVGPALAYHWHANPPFANIFHNLPTMAQLSVLLARFNDAM